MRDSDTSAVRELYDTTAESYAEMMDAEINLPLYADVLDRLARRIAQLPGPVIDTSCGSGHMLALYRERYDPARALVGVDLSPRMVDIARSRLGPDSDVRLGDMCDLHGVEAASCAAVISFFALHHLSPDGIRTALQEWRRVLMPHGQLVLATWEGSGPIDYHGETDLVALRYERDAIAGWAEAAGFAIDRCVVEPVEEMPMDAIYLEGF